MEARDGKVYKLALQPLTTSNYFAAGHRLRIEVSSSNFPRFDRNLNTGGNNYDESKGVVAHNAVHHSKQYPSQVTVVKRAQTSSRNRSASHDVECSTQRIRRTLRRRADLLSMVLPWRLHTKVMP